MIRGFKDKQTRLFAEGERVKQFQPFKKQAEKRLRILEAAQELNDLIRLPSNHLEALSGKRKGPHGLGRASGSHFLGGGYELDYLQVNPNL